MLYVLLLASLAIASQAQHYHPRAVYVNPIAAPVRYVAPAPADEAPKPYSYSYSAPAEGGASSREETSDGSGRVTGSYTVSDEDGRQRVVEYVADEGGFRANIRTNEPGTANQSPADVSLESTAPEDGPLYAAPVKPVAGPVLNRIVAPAPVVAPAPIVAHAPLTYNIAPVNRYYSPVGHRHGYYGNRGLYSPYGLHSGYHGGHGHYGGLGQYGGLYGNYGHGLYNNYGHGLYGNLGHRGYYPGSRYLY